MPPKKSRAAAAKTATSSAPPPCSFNPLGRVVFAQHVLKFAIRPNADKYGRSPPVKHFCRFALVSEAWFDTISNYGVPILEVWRRANPKSFGKAFFDVCVPDCSYGSVRLSVVRRLNLLKQFIAAGANPNQGGYQVLFNRPQRPGAEYEHTDLPAIIAVMFNMGRNDTNHAVDVITALLAAGADVTMLDHTREKETLLQVAASLSACECMAAFLKCGGEKIREQVRGALKIAAEANDGSIIATIVEAGGQPSKDDLNFALRIAVKKGSEYAASALLGAGAEIEAVDEEGTTPLMLVLDGLFMDFAEEYDTKPRNEDPDRISVLETLLEHGANIDAADKNGRSVLQHFLDEKSNYEYGEDEAEGVCLEAITLLLQAGATVTEELGEEMLEMAEECEDDGFVAVVERAMEGGYSKTADKGEKKATRRGRSGK